RAPRRELGLAAGETKTASEVAEREEERPFARAPEERELARCVEAVVEPRLAPCGCEAVAAITAGNDYPIFRRQVFARERGTTSDLRSEEHTSELQSHLNLVCRLLL